MRLKCLNEIFLWLIHLVKLSNSPNVPNIITLLRAGIIRDINNNIIVNYRYYFYYYNISLQ